MENLYAEFADFNLTVQSNETSNVPTTFAGTDTAWHGILTRLSDSATKDYGLAIEEAGMDWEAELIPNVCPLTGRQIANSYNVYKVDRVNKHAYLFNQNVSDTYAPFKTREALKFLADITGDGYRIDSIGELDNGRVIFANVCAAQFEVVKGDEHKMFKQFQFALDSSLAYTAMDNDFRQVCSNTCRHALEASEGRQLKFRSTVGGQQRLAASVELLRLAGKSAEIFANKLHFLASKRITQELKTEFYKAMFPGAFGKDGGLKPDAKTIATLEAQEQANGISGIEGTFYGLLNQFTAAYTHSNGMAESQRIGNVPDKVRQAAMAGNANFGSYATKKQQALSILLDIAKKA